MREETRTRDVANSADWAEEVLVKKKKRYQKQPPTHSRGKNIQPPPNLNKIKQNKNNLLPPKENHIETNALQEVLMCVFLQAW